MTPEQQREQWLKRILPGLVITVIYFVFISNIISDKTQKAEETYTKLMQRGISPASMPGLQSQNKRLTDELTKLNAQDKTIKGSLAEKAGFLYSQEKNSNKTVELIAAIFARHRLRITEDSVANVNEKTVLPLSIENIRFWLHESLEADQAITLQHIAFVGRYLDVYAMLSQLSEEKIQALPVSLTMTHLDTQNYENTGFKKWLLTLWI